MPLIVYDIVEYFLEVLASCLGLRQYLTSL